MVRVNPLFGPFCGAQIEGADDSEPGPPGSLRLEASREKSEIPARRASSVPPGLSRKVVEAKMSDAQPQLQWSENHDAKYPVGSKQGEVRLNVDLSMYVYQPTYKDPPGRFLLVSLSGTEVKPTQDNMEKDQTDIRGFFTEEVDVTIGFEDSLSDGLILKQDSPDTTAQTGSVTSSISLSFNAGFFGTDLTAGAGLSISNSISASLSDFSIINRSNNTIARHSYAMSMVQEGARYTGPGDLPDMSAAGQFQGCPLYHIPARASSNLPILSQALFWTPQELNEMRHLLISVTHVTRKVEKTFQFFTLNVQNWKNSTVHNFEVPVDFSKVG